MMKKLKQFGALMLALVLAVALCCPALAAGDTTGSITINNAVEGKTYTVYKLLDATTSGKSTAYTVNSAWKTFFESDAAKEYVTVDKNDYVTWIKKDEQGKDTDAKGLADAAITYAKSHTDKITGKTQSPAKEGNDFVVKFTGLDYGYYLVESNVGTLCALTTAAPNAEFNAKNQLPTVDKQVQEDSQAGENGTSGYGKVNDADIGQTVNYKTTINVTDGNTTGYVLHDTMTAGLDFDETSVTVLLNSSAMDKSKYTVKTGTNVSETTGEKCTFEVSFGETTFTSGDVITVSYSATLNENALVGTAGEGNLNKTKLEYANGTTVESTTRTYTWQMDVFKYTGSNTPLAGAQFKLYKQDGQTNSYATLEQVKEDGKDTNTWKVTGWDANGTVFTSPEGGNLSIIGLDADTYYLEETKAPDGYNKLSAPITVQVTSTTDTATNTMTFKLAVNGSDASKVNVQNNAGTELPTTGGMGTTVLYVVGGVLVVCAGVALVAKKRMQ